MNKTTSAIICTTVFLLASCGENNLSQNEKNEPVPDATTVAAHEASTVVNPSVQHDKKPQPGTVTHEMGVADTTTRFMKSRLAGDIAPTPPHRQPQGRWNRESYAAIDPNGFINSRNDSLSTFSIDVDTASYANIRRFINNGSLPPIGAVRAEEMINYFSYQYPEPSGNSPFSLSAEIGPSPFNGEYSLVKIGLKARDTELDRLPPSNLVFLIDVSGSMNQPEKLPLLKKSMKMIVKHLGSQDRVSIVVYAGSDRVVLMPTPAHNHEIIMQAIDNLQSGGSTHGSGGIITAYELAHRAFIPKGNNRIILASDGDFNVGVTSRGELQKLIETQRETGVFLTVLGFGMGNFHDDTMEILADKGNGNYAYIDSLLEAKKVLEKEMSGTLFTLASDVKIQVEFNPALAGAYRLIGYENRSLADEDFRDDTKDAGEIGIGHTVTALYEIIPTGHRSIPEIDELKYQKMSVTDQPGSRELLTVKVRYKQPGAKTSSKISLPVIADSGHPAENSDDFHFATAVAGYSMLLTDSAYLGSFSWNQCLQLAREAKGKDPEGYRAEFYRIVEMSQLLKENG